MMRIVGRQRQSTTIKQANGSATFANETRSTPKWTRKRTATLQTLAKTARACPLGRLFVFIVGSPLLCWTKTCPTTLTTFEIHSNCFRFVSHILSLFLSPKKFIIQYNCLHFSSQEMPNTSASWRLTTSTIPLVWIFRAKHQARFLLFCFTTTFKTFGPIYAITYFTKVWRTIKDPKMHQINWNIFD